MSKSKKTKIKRSRSKIRNAVARVNSAAVVRSAIRKYREIEIEAKASGVNDATSGSIVICSENSRREISTVVFTPEKAERLLEKMEEASITVNKVYLSKRL